MTRMLPNFTHLNFSVPFTILSHVGLLTLGYLPLGSQNHYCLGEYHAHKDNEQEGGHISEANSIATHNGDSFVSCYSLSI